MSALVRYFLSKGISVSGYDRTQGFITRQLENMGVSICYDDSLSHLPPSVDMVVYTPAIPQSHKQLTYFLQNNFTVKKRAEVLGLLAKGKTTVSVAGTHGKTTISSMIAHIMKCANSDFMAFLGGVAKNYDANFISAGNESVVVAEADEYDRSFLNLYSDIAVITALDADHLDVYASHEKMIESYNDFTRQIKDKGTLIINENYIDNIYCKPQTIFTYSLDGNSTYKTKNLKISDGSYVFDVLKENETLMKDVCLNFGGLHNIENAVAAIAVALEKGISTGDVCKALNSFEGIHRRFDIRIKHENLVYIDDYAHHPKELKVLINAVRQLFKEKKILGVFQPHLYSRTRDFAEEFAQTLSLLDEVLLLDIYHAREKPIPGVTSQIILDKIKAKSAKVCSKHEVTAEVMSSKADVVLTIGAGDIDALVAPLEKSLMTKLKASKKEHEN